MENNNTQNLKRLADMPVNRLNNIRYYAQIGRLKLIETNEGLMFDEVEYIQAKTKNQKFNHENLLYISNEDMKKEPYALIGAFNKNDTRYRYILKKGIDIKKYYNTDDFKLYCKVVDLVQPEVKEISSYTGIAPEKLNEWITENAKK